MGFAEDAGFVIELIEGQLDGRGERGVVLRSDDVRFDCA